MLLAKVLLLAGTAASSGAAGQPVSPVEVAAAQQDENQTFFALELGEITLSDGITAYGTPSQPFLPVGEISRLLDLNLIVSPAEKRLTGSVGQSSKSVTVDLSSRTARIGGETVRLKDEDFVVTSTEIYLSAALLERVVPAHFVVDGEALVIEVQPTETLPIQSRMERLARLRGLQNGDTAGEEVSMAASPYEIFSPPSFDVAVQTGKNSSVGRLETRYDVRAAGDLMYAGLEAYLGSDEHGRPADARITLERRSIGGRLLGPLGATRLGVGDVFNVPLSLGPRSISGRGFSVSTAPLEQASIFDMIDLRGELPIGYDVELYVNDVLRGGQRSPQQGRYEFIQVPLVRGLNVIRIVTYGPRGDRSEQVRVITVGGGQLQRGQTTMDLSVVEAGEPVIDLRRSDKNLSEKGARLVASLVHGITEKLTVVSGLADYVPVTGKRRRLVSAGVRTSVKSLAVQADAAFDHRSGGAVAFGIAGQPGGVSVVARHAEYWNGFVDENGDFAAPGTVLRRQSQVTLDTTFLSIAGKVVPVSLRALRSQTTDEASILLVGARASATAASFLLSAGLDYERRSDAGGVRNALAGVFAASTFLNYQWQLRAAADFGLVPSMQFRAINFTADRSINDRLSLRLGIGSVFEGQDSASVQLGANLRTPLGDLSGQGGYVTATGEFSVGLRFAAGLAYDPLAKRYRITAPGAAAGGILALDAFYDRNGNGVRDPLEEGVDDVAVEGAERGGSTDADGHAFVVNLGNAPIARLRVVANLIDAYAVSAPASLVQFSPRPGKVLKVQYPVIPVGEVALRVVARQGTALVGVSALRVQLVRDGGTPIDATTEYDGSVIFNAVPAGHYRVELDEEQASRLGMRLATTPGIDVDPDAPPASERVFEILFGSAGEGGTR